MTEENIKARIAVLEGHKDRLLAELNQTEGAIADCQYWLKEIAHPSPSAISANKEGTQNG